MPSRYWPLGEGRVVTSPWGPRPGGYHTGVDFGRDGGAASMPVYAIQAGTVVFAGAAQGYGGPDPHGWLVIDSTDADGGGCIEYGHITRLPNIGVGAKVEAGQQIAVINPDSRTNGGCVPHLHVADMPRGYDPAAKQDPMKRLSGALEPGQQNTGNGVTTKILDYDRSIVPQETGYNCGPAAAQIVLNSAGIKVSESQLAREMGTHTGGTDTIDMVLGALKKHAPQAKFASVWMPNDPPTKAQKDALWNNTVNSINAGWAMVCNWVAPPSNHPRPVAPSNPALGPNYGGSTVWHYVCCAGYSDEGMRKVWIADSGFKPYGYWVSFDQHATLIPPKGYTYSTLVATKPPAPQPPEAPSQLDVVFREVSQRLPGRTFDDAELLGAITDPGRVDTMLGHAINAASLSRINYELLRRIAEKLDVEVGDIR